MAPQKFFDPVSIRYFGFFRSEVEFKLQDFGLRGGSRVAGSPAESGGKNPDLNP